MRKYEPSVESDLALLHWWMRLRDEGELDLLFEKKFQPLSQFYNLWQSPMILVFEGDAEHGITLAAWMCPTMAGATFGLWVARERRSSPRTFWRVVDVYRKALTLFPVLLGITKQERLLKVHRRLGYTVSERIPRLFDDDDAWIVTLTRENFKWPAERQVSGRSKAERQERSALPLQTH